MESYKIDESMLEKIKALKLPQKKENNEYILLHVYGDNRRAPETFNAKVYTGKKGLKLVTNDYNTLIKLIDGRETKKTYDRIICIDDSGWGFPLGGVLVGAYDNLTKDFVFKEIGVKFFQGQNFEQKRYLHEYADKGISIISELKPNRDKTLIKICTGFINKNLKEDLRTLGFDVEIAKIGEPLQSELEKKHKEYVKEKFGYDAYYDPKELAKKEIVSEFDNVVEFIKKNKLIKFAKSGWDCFKQ